ncbi:hydroxyurea phosphotransferase [Streptomyces sp. AJS327]|uniref:aminoglycoside phosphotransferase family protein n=1 Tax=Streptomyces sp. AJS327 TaxID=2545265 RepID=UPI0015DDD4AD|nr:aminoglycoside phosphotransferase family protein [Streptomyces sp. AJS327]MBA0052188.1 hydroxyurea phosphotransferase [Streptomyces sp. AJS327]
MPEPLLFPATLPVLTEMRRTASGREWLHQLPDLVDELRRRWRLRLKPPYHGGSCSWAAPVERPDGSPAVLKVTWPHPEATHEGRALDLWAGNGAARVYDHDAERYALLLERCQPGTELGTANQLPAEHRLLAAAQVLHRLWRDVPAASPFDPLRRVTGEWADLAEQRAAREWPPELDQGLFTTAARLLRELPATADREVLLHGDFNPGNILAAEREPWLAIDAKPVTGDPAFDPWPLLEQVDDPFAHPDPHRVLRHRTALLADALDLDVHRLRAWTVARHVEYVLWSVEEDASLDNSVRMMRQARILADVAAL